VDAKAGRHPISPNIYGFAYGAKSDLAATNFTMNRSGGNGTSTYNWQINAANHASDWYFESILDPPETPGYDGDSFISQTRIANVGAQPLLTIPMINYLAKLGPGGAMLWSYSIAKYGLQTGSDPYQPDAGNGIGAATGKAITGNNPLDANTPNSVSIQQAWVQHLISTWGLAANGGLKYYIMDNEPSLWNSTHRDIHPAPETYSEIYNDYVSYAGAVRALDPNAVIVGPEEWSWWAMFLSGYDQLNGIGGAGSDYNTHHQTYYNSFTPIARAPANSFSMCSAFTTIPWNWRTATMIPFPDNSSATSRRARFGIPPMWTPPGSTKWVSTAAS
jgi:hypothetical protein